MGRDLASSVMETVTDSPQDPDPEGHFSSVSSCWEMQPWASPHCCAASLMGWVGVLVGQLCQAPLSVSSSTAGLS